METANLEKRITIQNPRYRVGVIKYSYPSSDDFSMELSTNEDGIVKKVYMYFKDQTKEKGKPGFLIVIDDSMNLNLKKDEIATYMVVLTNEIYYGMLSDKKKALSEENKEYFDFIEKLQFFFSKKFPENSIKYELLNSYNRLIGKQGVEVKSVKENKEPEQIIFNYFYQLYQKKFELKDILSHLHKERETYSLSNIPVAKRVLKTLEFFSDKLKNMSLKKDPESTDEFGKTQGGKTRDIILESF